MSRRLFTLTSALSLILCLATVVLWVRSYWIVDGIGFGNGYHVESERGRVWVEQLVDIDHAYMWHPGRYAARVLAYDSWDEFLGPNDNASSMCGFGHFHGRRAIRSWNRDPELSGLWDLWPVTSVFAPHWCVLVVAGLVPAMAGCRLLNASARRTKSRCIGCGYDLRATPDRCPECGTDVPQKAEAGA